MTGDPPEAPITPLTQDAAGGQVACKKPGQKFPRRWAEAMDGRLPSQVLRPLRDARSHRLSTANRVAALDAARDALRVREAHHEQWSDSVDQRMDDRGMEYVDHNNALQAAAFLARIGITTRAALAKRQETAVAIEVAKLEIQRLEQELGCVAR